MRSDNKMRPKARRVIDDWPPLVCEYCHRTKYPHEQFSGLTLQKWLKKKYCTQKCYTNVLRGIPYVETLALPKSSMAVHHVDSEIINNILLRDEVKEYEQEYYSDF